MDAATPSHRALGIRQKLYRNRKVSYRVGQVITDGLGNILDRPLTERLPCFGDPVEQLWGRFDEPRRWGDKEPEPRGCALCPVAMFCASVAWERIESSAELLDRYYAWERATRTMSMQDRHRHPLWGALVVTCEADAWSDANDRKLQEKEEARISKLLAAAARKASATRERKKPKPRPVPRRVVNAIGKYRDQRVRELQAAKRDSKAPLWVRNRSIERCVLVADAWQAREVLERGNRKASANEVRKWLDEHGRLERDAPEAMTKRVNEALKRADQLIENGTWPPFDPEPYHPPRGAAGATGMHPSAVYIELDRDLAKIEGKGQVYRADGL